MVYYLLLLLPSFSWTRSLMSQIPLHTLILASALVSADNERDSTRLRSASSISVDRVISTSTGHQVSDGQRDRRLYLQDREHKLVLQRDVNRQNGHPQVLSNVRVYIDGFLENTTDIEMKRIVIRAGGQVV